MSPAALFPDLDHEIDATRRVLGRVPDDRLDWRPHAKSWTLAELASHLSSLLAFGTDFLTTAGAADYAERPVLGSRDALVERWDETARGFRVALEASDLPADAYAGVRQYVLSHVTHHRGQLTVYLRLLDVPVPNTYGPTADEA